MVIFPWKVNFMALVMKFINTWFSLFLSLTRYNSGRSGARSISTPVFAFPWNEFTRSVQSCRASISFGFMSKVPASILDRSRISEINCSNNRLFSSTISAYCFLSSGSFVSCIILEKPTMALRGVRISWLILARKADFNRSDSSAFSLASISFNSVSFSSVMSKLIQSISMILSCGR